MSSKICFPIIKFSTAVSNLWLCYHIFSCAYKASQFINHPPLWLAILGPQIPLATMKLLVHVERGHPSAIMFANYLSSMNF